MRDQLLVEQRTVHVFLPQFFDAFSIIEDVLVALLLVVLEALADLSDVLGRRYGFLLLFLGDARIVCVKAG